MSQYDPEFRKKVIPIEGDLLEPNLGISSSDEKLLIDECNIIFHSAATVRFDEPLKYFNDINILTYIKKFIIVFKRLAVEMNIIGVQKMIALAKKLKHLEVFVHVSTAYANCDRQHISETVYNPPIQPEKLLEAVDWMEEDLVKLLTPKIVRFRPNTYTYTKAIAECLVLGVQKELPMTIVRPSIVGASWREPFPGWIDNYNGPTALFISCGKGVLKAMLGNRNAIADIIPVDQPVNMIIASGWFRGSNRTKQTIVYNCTTGQINPLRWGVVESCSALALIKNPFENVFMYPNPSFTNFKIVKQLRVFIEQLLPSYIMDLYLKLIHKKPM